MILFNKQRQIQKECELHIKLKGYFTGRAAEMPAFLLLILIPVLLKIPLFFGCPLRRQ